MRQFVLITFLAFVSLMNVYSQTAEKFASDWDEHHISTMFPSDVRHSDLKKYLDQLKKLGIKVDQVGVSNANREIYQIEWGKGPLKVFMWSQMHGDEPTATSSLIDMFAFLQKHHDKDWVKKISETMTIRAVPMLNPDGQELYQRRNLQGIDINRDALDLKTPEARLLKQLRDDWNPSIGFNLHNQQALTTVGRAPSQASISFLVVFGDEAKTLNPGQERNQRIASGMVTALQKYIPGHIGRYGDEWTPTAFGDNFSAWGTPTILIETGALYGKDESYLVKMNYIAFMTALNSIATGSEKNNDPNIYINLTENGSGGLVNFVFRKANVVIPDPAATTPGAVTTKTTDISAVTERRRASFVAPVRIRNVGDATTVRGLEEYDASGFNVVQRFGQAKAGELAEFFFYKKDRTVDWASTDLEKQFPPDAVFSGGKFVKGEKLVPRR
ncbi:MAG: M14 family zinc carboxypeptidase [Pyrinomonadaceae bacterium]